MKAALRLVVLLLASALSSRAELTMSLSQSVQNSARGLEIVYSGTLTNTSATEKVFLNDIAGTLSGASASNLTLKPNAFFSNVPGVLLPNESYTNSELFRVVLSGAAPSGDYGGTITLRGGADIFANNDLASAAFTVLSPAVSVSATDANASEFGPDTGTFTVSRTGSTPIDLPVYFALAGTAVNGSAYQAISPTITIPAGSNSALVTITPIPNNLAEGDRFVDLTLTASNAYNLSSSVAAQVTIHDKPADAWRFEKFGANANDPAAADPADWDRDGIANLLEFALNLDPKTPDNASLPAAYRSGDYLLFAFSPNAAATDVNFIVEGAPDLATWDSANVEFLPMMHPLNLLTYRYKYSFSEALRGFIRLRVVRTDL